MWLIRGSGGFQSYPLVRFDLTAFAGRTVLGSDAVVEFLLISGHGGVANPTQSVSLAELQVSWSESTASFSNFGGGGFNAALQVGSPVATRNVTYSGSAEAIQFTIPAILVQDWIDDDATNLGLILTSSTVANFQDLVFATREGVAAPTLSFSISPIPEPGVVPLLAGALAAFAAAVRRCREVPGNR